METKANVASAPLKNTLKNNKYCERAPLRTNSLQYYNLQVKNLQALLAQPQGKCLLLFEYKAAQTAQH
jgi:hypothetical protein